MKQLVWQLCLLFPALIGGMLLSSQVSALESQIADETVSVKATETDPEPMDQVTSVSQLSDVQPTDWAFQALQSLVERYGCIAGYPDGTYRGNRAMTRYEFAAGLNACMDRVNELIAAATADLVRKEDLATLKKLQDEFAAELKTLRGRVDALEARTAKLEAQQFSTTTKLNGEVVAALTSVFSGSAPVSSPVPDPANGFGSGREVPRIPVFGTRTRLNFDTSFTGKDLLRTRLQAISLSSFSNPGSLGTVEGDLRMNAGATTATNRIGVDALLYSFPIGDRTMVVLEGNAGAADDFANTLNPYLDGDGGTGALSNFGTRNPIYYYMSNNAGIGIRHQFSDALEFSAGYLARTPNSPTQGNGLFNGAYGAIGQLTFTPNDRFGIGLTYINAYNVDTGTGSNASNLFAALQRPVVTNSYGVQASFRVTPGFVINGWAGYTSARVINTGDAEIWNYAVSLVFPDLGKQGNLAGIIVGMQPRLTGSAPEVGSFLFLGSDAGRRADRDTSFHIEGFYTFKISDNIGITPGVIWITAPNHDARNNGTLIGVVRTTFTF